MAPIRELTVEIYQKIHLFLPSHSFYLEVCGGTETLLFVKPPSLIETFNDEEGAFFNLFSVLRDEAKRIEFKAVALGKLASSQFEEVNRAWSFYSKISRSIDLGLCFPSRIIRNICRGRPWLLEFFEIPRFEKFYERVLGIQVDEVDTRTALKRYDRAKTFFYFSKPPSEELFPDLFSLEGMAGFLTSEEKAIPELEAQGWAKAELGDGFFFWRSRRAVEMSLW